MSKGLGEVQRQVIAALQSRRGGDTVASLGREYQLLPGEHDIRWVTNRLAHRLNRGRVAEGKTAEGAAFFMCAYQPRCSWSASVARALRNLRYAQLIEQVCLPGHYGRRIRCVRLTPKGAQLNLPPVPPIPTKTELLLAFGEKLRARSTSGKHENL
jgi:hypothetical protein